MNSRVLLLIIGFASIASVAYANSDFINISKKMSLGSSNDVALKCSVPMAVDPPGSPGPPGLPPPPSPVDPEEFEDSSAKDNSRNNHDSNSGDNQDGKSGDSSGKDNSRDNQDGKSGDSSGKDNSRDNKEEESDDNGIPPGALLDPIITITVPYNTNIPVSNAPLGTITLPVTTNVKLSSTPIISTFATISGTGASLNTSSPIDTITGSGTSWIITDNALQITAPANTSGTVTITETISSTTSFSFIKPVATPRISGTSSDISFCPPILSISVQ